jgi:hypothetical protein
MPPHHVAQFNRGDHLYTVAPLIKVPGYLELAAGGGRDAQRGIWFFGDNLVGVESELVRGIGRAGRNVNRPRFA